MASFGAPGAAILADLKVEEAIIDECKRLKNDDPTPLSKCLAGESSSPIT